MSDITPELEFIRKLYDRMTDFNPDVRISIYEVYGRLECS
jgi:hypothetical protein